MPRKAPKPMSDKARRRESRKIEKKIFQGKKKIRLPDGTIIDGKRIQQQRTSGVELREYYQQMQLYISVLGGAALALRAFTAQEVPAGLKVLAFLSLVPALLTARLLLNTLVPLEIVGQGRNRQLVQEGGGSLLNSIMLVFLSVELTKFVQFCLRLYNSSDAGNGTETASDNLQEEVQQDFNSDGIIDDNDIDPSWKPPRPQVNLYELSAQNGLTQMFLYGIPYLFSAAFILMLLTALLRVSKTDPVFRGSNLRMVRTFQPLMLNIGVAFTVSTAMAFLDSDSVFLHPLFTPLGVFGLLLASKAAGLWGQQ